MLASRVAKPKLSLSISTSTVQASRPNLSLKSPLALTPLRSPSSPMPASPTPTSPTARNTRLNRNGFFSTMQQPTYAYVNTSSSRSILKRSSSSSSSSLSSSSSSSSSSSLCSSPASSQVSMSPASITCSISPRRQLSFTESPVVYTVTPIEEPDYYGTHQRMSKDDRRWLRR